MQTVDKNFVSILDQLIETCKNCEAAYLNAIEKESTEELRDLYRQYSAEMIKCREELEIEVKRLGGNLDLLKRDMEEKVSDKLLELDVEREEKHALALYDQALDLEWPGQITEILRRHFT